MKKALTVTPTGLLTGFVAIEKPSTKFDDNGVYSCQVAFTGKDAKGMKGIIDGLMAESVAAGAKRGVTKVANAPYTIEGKTLIVKFKQKAKITSRAGKSFDLNVKVYDGSGKELNEDTSMAADSEVKIAFSSYAWAVAALGCGVTLQPNSLQIIKLVKYSASGSNPFGDEGGYKAAEKDSNPFEAAVEAAPVVEDDDEDIDF